VHAAKALQVAWRIRVARAQWRSTRRAELARRLQLVCAERRSGMRLRGGGDSSERVLRARAAVVYAGGDESSEASSVELDSEDEADESSDSENDDGALSSRGSAGGKGRRNGAALTLAAPNDAAAKLLPELASRQNSIVGKAKWRDAHRVHGELPMAAVNVATMPRRAVGFAEGPVGEAEFTEAYRKWHDKALRARVMQQRCAAQYEKKVGLVNDWLTRQGHPPFAEWVEARGDERGWTLILIVEDGAPRVPSVEAVCEWAFCYATGDAKKGGDREYRNMPWYGTVSGERQGERLMPEGKERAYGHGSYADEPPRFVTIEQYMTAIRQWLSRALKDYPEVANPMLTERLREAMATLEGQTSRAVVESRLPRTLTEEEVQRAIRTARVTVKAAGSAERALEEAQDLMNIVTNVAHGVRAHDKWLLDWTDIQEVQASEEALGGVNFQHVGTKNNKKQRTQKKGLTCTSVCPGELALNEDGMLDVERFCASHLVLHARMLQAMVLGVDAATLDVPVYARLQRVAKLHAGSTLVAAEEASVSEDAPSLVCVVTHEEHVAGYVYNRTVPFVINGKEHWPPERGCWFEVAGTGYALRAWATATGDTTRLRKLLLRGAKREGVDVDVSKITSKTLRRTMATVLSKKVSMSELVQIGGWTSEAMARKYIETLNVFAKGTPNYSDLALLPTSAGDILIHIDR
jgi:integrase